MSRNFHHIHVHAPTATARARIEKIVLAYAKKGGYERVPRANHADRVIRLGGGGPWLSITDDGYEISAIAKAISKAAKRPILEAYCEASAIVWLALHANGKAAGGWGGGRRPTAKLVAPLLVEGTPASFAAAWEVGARQTFPEDALAIAANHFGMTVDRMFLDANIRGTTIALRRKNAAWKPSYKKGAPSFDVGWTSNQGGGYSHLVFEEQLEKHRLTVTATGGPSRGLSIRFGGTIVDNGHVEIVACESEGVKLVRAGDTWRDPNANVPAGLVTKPDLFSLGGREADKARAIEWACERMVDVQYRCIKEGEGQLTAVLETEGGRGEGSVDLLVMWKPWRPTTTLDHVDSHKLFNMHRREHAHLHLALRGTLADAWVWARPHVEAWAVAHEDICLRVRRDYDVVLAENRYDQETLSYDKIGELFPSTRTLPFQASGNSFLFGTYAFVAPRMDPREELVTNLVLGARCADGDQAATFARLTAIADDSLARNLVYSGVLSTNVFAPSEKSGWEDITAPSDDPLKLVRWHETHVRGLDKRMWFSAEHAALVDRDALARHATVTSVGTGCVSTSVTINRAVRWRRSRNCSRRCYRQSRQPTHGTADHREAPDRCARPRRSDVIISGRATPAPPRALWPASSNAFAAAIASSRPRGTAPSACASANSYLGEFYGFYLTRFDDRECPLEGHARFTALRE